MRSEAPGIWASIGLAGGHLRPAVTSTYFHRCQSCYLPPWGHELLQLGHPSTWSLSPSALPTGGDGHHVNGINYIDITQNNTYDELGEYKAIAHRELISVTPFLGRKKKAAEICTNGLVHCSLMVTDMNEDPRKCFAKYGPCPFCAGKGQ